LVRHSTYKNGQDVKGEIKYESVYKKTIYRSIGKDLFLMNQDAGCTNEVSIYKYSIIKAHFQKSAEHDNGYTIHATIKLKGEQFLSLVIHRWNSSYSDCTIMN
jgi:hypothetical protein